MKECFQKLFTAMFSNPNDTYMFRILSKVWPDKLQTNIEMAYAIAVCQIMLHNYYEKLTMSEDTVKNRLRRNLRKIQQKKKLLPPGEGESTEDEEDEVVEKKGAEKNKKSYKYFGYKNFSSNSQSNHEATHEATPESTQEEPLEGSSTASARHLATLDEPQKGSTASAGHLATHNA
ncbi:hypothetical protein C2G38_2264029 [Gigaspora rosea]|uniref:Uncharacterized protein n=1 Tax=Gigaspora rosea TaxID=44941 RepID=A0A397UPF9_9GLOM|nr:hypothetical protein C2G38_2264029 [Gigaspora rosea]